MCLKILLLIYCYCGYYEHNAIGENDTRACASLSIPLSRLVRGSRDSAFVLALCDYSFLNYRSCESRLLKLFPMIAISTLRAAMET